MAAVGAGVAAAVALAVLLGGRLGAGAGSSSAGQPAAAAASGRHAVAVSSHRPIRRCATADLSVAPVSHTVKQALDIERFAVTTAAADGCVLAGAPDLRPKGPLAPQVPGAMVDLAVSQLPLPDGIDLPAGDGAAVALLPGRPAAFYLAWYSTSPVVCVQSNGFAFNAPGDPSYADMKTVAYGIGPVCDGIFYVSPLFSAGT